MHADDHYVILVRLPTQIPTYRFIRPWSNELVTPGNAYQVLEEANRAFRNWPEEATFAWAYESRALHHLGRHQESFEAQLKVPETLVIR